MIPLDSNARQSLDDDGFLLSGQLIDGDRVTRLRQAFDDLFDGNFETGVRPDEVNWQKLDGDPTHTRQICNGWKANREIASLVLDETLAATLASLAGWPGIRIMQDNVICKPPGASSLGYHQDSAYLAWYTPPDMFTCWIALDDTCEAGGTLEFVRGSHRWPLQEPQGEFHAPEDYRQPMFMAAEQQGVDADIAYVEIEAGSASFHHGWTWHGSGPNRSPNPRRALVLHAMRSEVEYMPANFDQGTGPIYSRYKRLGDNQLDENYFPILWREDGYRTAQIDSYLRGL